MARFSFNIIRQPRTILGQLIQFITGHNFMNRHQAIVDGDKNYKTSNNPKKMCDLCKTGEMTSEHIMSICPRLATIRQLVFNDPFPQPPYTDIKLIQLIDFLKIAKIPTLELPNSYKEFLEINGYDSASDTESTQNTNAS